MRKFMLGQIASSAISIFIGCTIAAFLFESAVGFVDGSILIGIFVDAVLTFLHIASYETAELDLNKGNFRSDNLERHTKEFMVLTTVKPLKEEENNDSEKK